jgi:CHAT domain-containing protein
MKYPLDECPDLETLAAYLDRRLSPRDRKRVAEHVAACETCYFVLAEAAQTHPNSVTNGKTAGELWREWMSNRRVTRSSGVGALATAACISLIVAAGWLQWWRPSESSELRALVAAVGSDRTIEARLTGGFSYGPLHGVVRAGEPSAATVLPDVRIAAARIEKEASAHRTPQALKSLGISYLVMGDFNRAVPVLEEAADQPSSDPRILSDLSAAYLVRAAHNNQPQDFAKALAVAERAAKSDPKVAEALFNRALALEALSLRVQAREAWQEYLKVDSKSGWAEEARTHLKALTDSSSLRVIDDERREVALAINGQDSAAAVEIVRKSPQAVRDSIEEQLLVAWPRLVLDGRYEEAHALIRRIEPWAAALAQQRDDAFLDDAVAAVVRASGDDQRTRTLATAHRIYQSAVEAYNNDRIRESTKLVRESLESLDQAGSSFAASARRYQAIGAYYANDLAAAFTEIGDVALDAQKRRYPRLLGLAYRLRGLIHVTRGELADGLDEYQAALKCFRLAGDVASEAAIDTSLAEDFHFIGETQQSWSAWYAALSHMGTVRDPVVRHLILQGASTAALRDEMPEAALDLQRAALDNARHWGRAPAVVTGYLNRAEIYSRLRQPQRAALDLAEAQRYLTGIHDPLLTSRNEARILLARGETLVHDQPTDAVEALSKALTYFERTGNTTRLASVYLARGRAYLAARREDLAEADFGAGIQVFEQMRTSLTSEGLRTSYFEQPWDLFTEMIRLQADRHDADRALIFAEQARARTLLEAVDAQVGAVPVVPAAVQQILPPGVVLLYYAALDDRLLIWVLKRSGQAFIDTPLRQADLARLVERYRPNEESVGRYTPTLEALYDALIRPIQSNLPDHAPVVVVPDGVLHAVPFAALIRREDHRYFVEDHVLETAPSLTIFQRSTELRRPARNGLPRALVVGNPRVDSGGSARLPNAEQEAREIAALYPDSELLLDADATKASFLDAAGAHEIVHFAGHGVSNDDYPGLSRLLFAGTGESTRSLFAHEVATMHFDRTQLVVLAACRTSAGRIRRGEGVFSLARPFIAAGVPTVVASLWDVDDRASRVLFVAFHRALRRGEAVSMALRSAQVAALADPDPILQSPANWAGFEVIGGLPALGAFDATGSSTTFLKSSRRNR